MNDALSTRPGASLAGGGEAGPASGAAAPAQYSPGGESASAGGPGGLVRRGRCHVFGDDIPLDDGLIPFEMAIRRIDDPAQLCPELLRLIDPVFPERVRPGDIVVAGANFGCGKPHFQGFIAMAALGISVVCASMPYKTLRGAISKGVPVLTGWPIAGWPGQDRPGQDRPGAAAGVRTGDVLEVDFAAGTVGGPDLDSPIQLPPLSPLLVDIVRSGGMRGMLAAWLRDHPDMAA